MAALPAFLIGCADLQRVGPHRYRVPADSLVPKSSYPFFLPRSEDDGFIFIANPDASLEDQRTVLVQQKEVLCKRASGTTAHINSTICSQTPVEWRHQGWKKQGDETWWTYSPALSSDKPAPFVSCIKMQIRGHPGLCWATLPAKDLVLTIDLNADELPTIEARYDEAVAKLKRWEVR